MKVRSVIRLLRRCGCYRVRQGRGSHEVWRTPGGRRITLVTNHANNDLSPVILRNTLRTLAQEGFDVA